MANLGVYYLGDAVVGYDPDFVVLNTPVGVVSFTLAAAIVPVLLYGVPLRWAANPAQTFQAGTDGVRRTGGKT